MSEAPKKIWVSHLTHNAYEYPINGAPNTQYIRADIFKEMQEALKSMIEEYRMLDLPYGSAAYAKATAATRKTWDL